MSARRVFLDTNVIIESFRIGAWHELSQGCWLETVQKCEEESLTGDTSDPQHVVVDPAMLKAGCRVIHPVTRKTRNKLFAHHGSMTSLDDGELELYAHLFVNESPLPPLLAISTADKGAIVRAKDLGWLDRLVSLEELLSGVGIARPKMAALRTAHRAAFLSDVRTKVYLNMIP
ncbi:MAG TPA: hypothetical protein VLJ86_11825 [Ramlibacter sp.]|nr:hypothetical protein [Ramlibacter sp.]